MFTLFCQYRDVASIVSSSVSPNSHVLLSSEVESTAPHSLEWSIVRWHRLFGCFQESDHQLGILFIALATCNTHPTSSSGNTHRLNKQQISVPAAVVLHGIPRGITPVLRTI